ncbi:GAE domain-containing protein [Heracleum sosnowskyi]|uniref:GAE domain-containing protein n=1 Tax=Heracleum sosnowskyi TaxID=360622 RepID=A0AAD8H7L9_9APIA|nr:GAE domain-containing protein [Heracleum sosnowskyi]
MDLLSIGTLPSQSSLSSLDGLSSSKDNSASIDVLEDLSSHTTLPVQASTASGGFPMMDLLDALPPFEKKHEDNGPTYPFVVAYESSSLRITFNFSKQPENVQTTLVEANFVNKSSNAYKDFIFQAAVPKVLKISSYLRFHCSSLQSSYVDSGLSCIISHLG